MRSNLGRLAVVALALGAVSAVSFAAEKESKYTLRVGTFLPGDTDMKNATTTYWFSVGVDRKVNWLKGSIGDSASYLSISADFNERGGNRSIPVTVNLNYPTAGFTYFVGGGVAITRLAGVDRNVTSVAATVGATYDLTKRLSLTAKYFVSGNPRFRGFGFYAGIKF